MFRIDCTNIQKIRNGSAMLLLEDIVLLLEDIMLLLEDIMLFKPR